MKSFFAVLLTLFVFINIGARDTLAVSASYQIREGGTLNHPTVSGVGRVVDWGLMYVPYDGERVMLSGQTDGTGSARIGDLFQLIITDPHGSARLFQYDNYNAWCSPINTPMSPQDISSYFPLKGQYNITFRYIDYCGGAKPVDSLYIVTQDQTLSPTPTVQPSPTPTSTPEPTVIPTASPTEAPVRPAPFLRLPWNYEKYGLTFGEAALRMSSYFDHEYPLLSALVGEPNDTKNSVVTFKNDQRTLESYTSHDGYDYAFGARALLGEPVLAAAAGKATFMNSCPACGNAILIDHSNRFQTRYYHLDKDKLIVSKPGKSIIVREGQQIGLVGATGNVLPAGDRGAHIHFMVVEDKNSDGNFEDNIPNGVTDPYGWKSTQADPWAQHTNGNISTYLWKNSLDETTKTVSQQGGSVSIPRTTFTFHPDSYPDAFTFFVSRSTPVTYGETLASVGNTFIAQAVAGVDTFVTQFNKLFTLEVDFSKEDLSAFKPETLAVYSSSDGTVWVKEQTVIDLKKKKATARIDHLSHFALMGARKDTKAPDVVAKLLGKEGIKGWFRSDVRVELNANEKLDYILYKLNDGDWDTYANPIKIHKEGRHTIEFYGADRAGNISKIRTHEFTIDKSIPEARMWFDTNSLSMEVKSTDETADVSFRQLSWHTKTEHVVIRDKAGNNLNMVIKERERGNAARANILSLRYNGDEEIDKQAELSVSYKLRQRDPQLRTFDQIYKIKGKTKVSLLYTAKSDKTKVMIKEKGKDKQKEVVNGMRPLQIVSDRGTLNYEY